MQTLFGLPINTILIGSVASVAFVLLMLTITALRNPVLLKAGIRNITRHPIQTSLIILGLMLATVLFSAALVTGDTLSYSIKKAATDRLSPADIIVQYKGKETKSGVMGMTSQSQNGYFSEKAYAEVKNKLAGSDLVDGIAPIVHESIPIVNAEMRQSVPGMTVLGVTNAYSGAMGALKTSGSKTLDILDLSKDEVYINDEAAEKLNVETGDEIQMFVGQRPVEMTVAGVFDKGGHPAHGPITILPAGELQGMLGQAEHYNEILISNKGDVLSGAPKTSKVEANIHSVIEDYKLEADPVKKDAIKRAEDSAAQFSSLFIIFGQFSMIAGVLLIFLIFVMLSAERKTELGVMRALGSQRTDILKLFVFEGSVYAALAAIVGSFAGLGVGWAMVRVLSVAFATDGALKIYYHFEPRSVIIAYAMGVLTTFAIVFFSAWRTGRINIVRAIRDIPEPQKHGKTFRSLIAGISLIVLGILLIISGIQSKQGSFFNIGVSMIIVGLPLAARFLGIKDRIAFSAAGIGLLAWWLMPFGTFEKLFPALKDMSSGIEMFFLSGMALVLGAVWTVMYNSDALLAIVVLVFGKLKGMPPMLKIAVNYPMRNRFRTGMALAMFSLVIFTMVFMGAILGAINNMFADIEGISGGFQIMGSTGFMNPIKDVGDRLDTDGRGIKRGDFEAIGGSSMAGVKMRESGAKDKNFVEFPIFGVDKGYTGATNYSFVLKDGEYDTDKEVWEALSKEKNVAVVHSGIVPAKTDYNTGNEKPDFMIKGFYSDDKKLPESYIEVKNPVSGKVQRLKVIGVMESMAVYFTNSVITSTATVDEISGKPVPVTSYWFKVNGSKDAERARETARKLSDTFYENGMSTTILEENIKTQTEQSLLINSLFQGFMGLGLIVGIAALGVIAARSVVERRRQIGMLRAIGFRKGMVQNTFLLENTFVSFLGIVVGTALGLLLSRNVIEFMGRAWPGFDYIIPWSSVIWIAIIAYTASLVTTVLPAIQASRVYPAEALRYE